MIGPMARTSLGLAALGCSALQACTLPYGSMARPVQPAADGAVLVQGGALVPFAVAGHLDVSDDNESGFAAATTDVHLIVPAGSFAIAYNEGAYFGLELATWATALVVGDRSTGDDDNDSSGIFVNPFFEFPLGDDKAARTVAFTIDAKLGLLSSRDTNGKRQYAPFIAPTAGVRWYLSTGPFGGFIFSQQIGTGVVTLTFPGSLAYDIPIPIGAMRLHLFPEVRWDPTFLFLGDLSGSLSFFSGGLSFMLEM
jgi:hypothetical protein